MPITAAELLLCMMRAMIANSGLSDVDHVMELLELLLFAGMLVVVAVIDIRKRIIPNGCIVAMLLIRIIYLTVSFVSGDAVLGDLAYYAASAFGIGAGILFLALVADKLFGGESMGGGDIKLYFVSGAYFGWQWGLVVVILSCLLGVASSALPFGDKGKSILKRAVPLGPAIAIACVVTMFLSSASGLTLVA